MDNEQKADKTTKISIDKLRLNNLANVKKSLSRIANETLRANVENGDITRLRSTAYVLNILVSAYKTDFENQLHELWEMVNNGSAKN